MDDGGGPVEPALTATRRAAPLLAAMAVVAAVVGWATRTADTVSILADEAGYLADARYLARAGVPFNLGTVTYYRPGYALLAVPIYAAFGGASTVYRAMIVVNVVLVTMTVPLAYLLARRLFTIARSSAAAVAAVVTLYPAWSLQANFVWSESLFAPLFLALALGVHEVIVHRRLWGVVLVGSMAPALALTHGRGLAPTAIVLVGLITAGVVRLIRRRDAAIGVGLLLAGLGVGRVLDTRLTAVLFEGDRRPDGELADSLRRASDVGGLLLTMAGQLWYLLVATAGLAGIGAFALAVRLRRPPGDGFPRSWRQPDRAPALVAMTIGALVASVVVTSSLFMTDRPRADHLIYGRYNDAAISPLLVCGLSWLVVHRDHRRLVAAGAITLATLAVTATALGLGRQDELLARPLNEVTVLGVYPWVAAFDGPRVLPITLVGAGLALALLAAAGLRRHLAVAAAGAMAVTAIAWLHAGFITDKTSGLPVVEQVTVVDDVVPGESTAAFAFGGTTSNLLFWAYQLYLPEMRFTRFDLAGGAAPGTDLVWAPVGATGPVLDGARLAYVDPLAGLGLHVRPGPRQDEMAARGALLPPGWPAVLPPEAAVGALVVRRAPTSDDGRTVQARLGLTHTGAGSPWPATRDPSDPTGAVRVAVRVIDPTCACQVVEGRADLPRMAYPRDPPMEVEVDVALDDGAEPLAAGRYEVRFELIQENLAVLPVAATATLVVP